MIRHYYRNAHAIIFVYDVTNRATFENLRRWIDKSNKNCLDDVPRILVGNKCDGHSFVPTNEAQHFADQYAMPVSTKDARNAALFILIFRRNLLCQVLLCGNYMSQYAASCNSLFH
nr:unnamed protein product [Callosobruchus chinensis]